MAEQISQSVPMVDNENGVNSYSSPHKASATVSVDNIPIVVYISDVICSLHNFAVAELAELAPSASPTGFYVISTLNAVVNGKVPCLRQGTKA